MNLGAAHLFKVWLGRLPLGERMRRRVARRGSRLRIAPGLSRLSSERSRLADLAQRIERRFGDLGAVLRQQLASASDLTRHNQALLAWSGRIQTGEAALAATTSRIKSRLEQGEAFAGELDTLVSGLSDYRARIQQLCSDQTTMERTLSPLRIIHSQFRIESARLPVELQASFAAITMEIARLDEEVQANFEKHAASLHALKTQVGATADTLRAQAVSLGASAQERRVSVQQSLARIERMLESSGRRDRSMREVIVRINRDSGAIIVNLQYQDITRQKLEHIQTALEELVAPLPKRAQTPDRLHRLGMLSRIQAGQIEGIQAELNQATSLIRGGLDAVLSHFQQIDTECFAGAALNDVIAEMDAMVTEIATTRTVTEELMLSSLQALDAATRQAHEFTQVTSRATGTMRQLANDIRLMGLNAQVQAVNVDLGSLEVLAGNAYSISVEAGRLIETFEADLQKSTEVLKSAAEASGRVHHDAQERWQTIRAEEVSLQQALQLEQQEVNRTLQGLVRTLDELKQQTDQLLGYSDLSDLSEGTLEQARAVLLTVATDLDDVCRATDREIKPDLSDVAARYTMDSERTIHAAVTGVVLSAVVPAAVSTAAGGAEVADFGLELFTDVASPDATAAEESRHEVPTAGVPVPLPADFAADAAPAVPDDPVKTAAVEGPPVAELGDNVELF